MGGTIAHNFISTKRTVWQLHPKPCAKHQSTADLNIRICSRPYVAFNVMTKAYTLTVCASTSQMLRMIQFDQQSLPRQWIPSSHSLPPDSAQSTAEDAPTWQFVRPHGWMKNWHLWEQPWGRSWEVWVTDNRWCYHPNILYLNEIQGTTQHTLSLNLTEVRKQSIQ